MQEQNAPECGPQEYWNTATNACEYCSQYVSYQVTYCGLCYDQQRIQVNDGDIRRCASCDEFHALYLNQKCVCDEHDVGNPPELRCRPCGLGRTADYTHTTCVCAKFFHEKGEQCYPDTMMAGCAVSTVLTFLVGLGGFVWWLWELRAHGRRAAARLAEENVRGSASIAQQAQNV